MSVTLYLYVQTAGAELKNLIDGDSDPQAASFGTLDAGGRCNLHRLRRNYRGSHPSVDAQTGNYLFSNSDAQTRGRVHGKGAIRSFRQTTEQLPK